MTSGDAELSVSLRWSRGSNHVISTKPGSDSVVYYNDYWAGLGFERVARIFVEGYSYASDYELTITYEVLTATTTANLLITLAPHCSPPSLSDG